ncbi:hypothetical protein K2O51_23010 [Cupriavidus pinatubonensis]|uniref:STY1053 family phage-associated protein n=1 Tax=Cupriavidus pinatubonensis TaxID=248026 RepID=UPI001C73DBD3|nr:hypothetical protein [Cupriavidus pinatubonensis]QYY30245.1 hypothetical protein K2O51_23010 [Cupriavidus pinatubonensis]
MPKIYVKKAFTLHHKDERHDFPVGNHTVPADVAEHWYVKAHTGEEPAAGEGEPDDLAEKRAVLDSAAEFLEGRAKQLKDLQDDLGGRERAVAEREQAAEQRDADLAKREATVAEREQAADKAAADAAKATKAK